ncbi:hypothetical protein [Haloferula sp.]|uniref:hypothetical protein n=1 Tax=Haloferula sp. TaxID=2497595 RepID=UPI003C780DE0
MEKSDQGIVVVFREQQVRQRKLAHFLKHYGIGVLPEGPELAELMGTFQFFVEGWDDVPEEVYAIPEIRKFYAHFHELWPYWFYFCDLETETLKMMTMCLLPNLEGFKRLGEPKAAVQYDPMELLHFIQRNFVPLNMMMERAGMSETDIYQRSGDIFRYYGLPYDAPPPE